jgi:hypothetical protein
MTISERIAAARRERRVLARVSRAAWRLEQAERERTWALVSARAEGISIRALAAAAGLSPSRVHQLVAGAGLDARTRRWVSCGQRAGRPPKTPAAMRMLTWTAAITSPTACRTRWTGCDSARAGSGSSTGAATRRRSTCARPDRALGLRPDGLVRLGPCAADSRPIVRMPARGEHPVTLGRTFASDGASCRVTTVRAQRQPGSVHREIGAMAYRHSIHVEAPVEKVFDFFRDPGDWRSVQPEGVEVTRW